MKRFRQMFVSLACAGALLATPLSAVAEGFVELDEPHPVIITEIQTGANTASDEFIELYNTSAEPVDITGWQVRYANAGAVPSATTLLATVSVNSDERIMLAGHSYFVFYTPTISLPEGAAGQLFNPSLSKTDKTVALFGRNDTTCQMNVQDAIAWEATPGTTLGLGEGSAISTETSGPHLLLQRYVDVHGTYVDTNNNGHDIWLAIGTPGSDNPQPIQPDGGTIPGTPSPLESFAAPNCTLPDPDPIPDPDPADPNEGLDPLMITELLPNPDTPLLEPNDEFVELYNPNDQPFHVAGYSIEVGTTTKKRYTFIEGVIEPLTYQAFYFPETDLRLVNSNGQARLYSPSEELLAETDVYATAGGNKAWALVEDTWQWVAEATPNEANQADVLPIPNSPVSPNAGLASPQITELLPAPSTGQLEFIELYNPNEAPFSLAGYTLETGTTTTYRFTFAEGTVLQSKTYASFYADQTNLTLANKAGQARLVDPAGAIIAQSDMYADAKTNLAWIVFDGTWQWSTTPSPNATNSLAVPQAKKVASASTKKKTSSPKSSKSTSKTAKQDDKNDGALLASTTPNDPLHPVVLAGVAAFAVLYGAYEYRNDFRSRIQKWRANRTARTTTGPGA